MKQFNVALVAVLTVFCHCLAELTSIDLGVLEEALDMTCKFVRTPTLFVFDLRNLTINVLHDLVIQRRMPCMG